MDEQQLTRNFCIIAHIDHGKSTLADRLLQHTGAVERRAFRAQVLDDMDLERERGITIKASAVCLKYPARDGRTYRLNLIDTPGHVDFSFEVVKSLKACEGALLVVDAAQGVEAQTVANYYLAAQHRLVVLPVLNKMDLNNAEPDRVRSEIHQLLQNPDVVITLASAKEGAGTTDILERIVHEIPPPQGDPHAPLQALVFDSSYDPYKGVVVFVRIVSGTLSARMSIQFMGTQRSFDVLEVGISTPHPLTVPQLMTGQVGFFTANIRRPRDVVAGDTVTETGRPAATPLPGFARLKPYVYAGVYPTNPRDFLKLRDAMEKLALNDAAFVFEPEQSEALGPGFRCGCLGLLHMDIIQERLEREYGVALVMTTPSVVYQCKRPNGHVEEIHSAADWPSPALRAAKGGASSQATEVGEPFVRCFLIVPASQIGAIMELAQSRRGVYRSTEFLSTDRAQLVYEVPLAELIVEFYDRLKSLTRGYGSMDYEVIGYRPSKLVKLDVLLNGALCNPLASIVPHDQAYERGKALVQRLKELIPRQLFEVAVQAAVGSNVIARETIRSMGKHVTAKCYGGDITRKRKLWDKQREGKKRMKQFGRVEIPQEAFLAVLKR